MTTEEANTRAMLERVAQLRRETAEWAAIDAQLAANVAYENGTITARKWLLAWLTVHGPTPKSEVVEAWLAYRCSKAPYKANWQNTLEVAFSRAKRRGLVDGTVLEWQGDSIWHLLEPGEEPFIWHRRGRYQRSPIGPGGTYRPTWGAIKRQVPMEYWYGPDGGQ